MRKYSLKNIILHPFLLGIYPVIALLGHNISEMRISEATRSILLMLVIATIIVVVLQLIFRSWRHAALAATLLIVAFFSYGYLYDFLQQTNPDLSVGRHRFLIPLNLVVISIGLWWIQKIRDLDTATQALNFMGIIAIIFPLYQIFSHGIITSVDVFSKRVEAASSSGLMASGDLIYPDIYYIILDAYPRNDVLQDVYGYDNSEFLGQLSEMGFYVAECSQSNYSKTSHSLTSSLNLNYLDVFGPKQPAGAINNFEALLISTSGLVLMGALTLFDIDILPKTVKEDIKSVVQLSPVRQRYVHVFHAFNELDEISSLPAPKFVFAHIIAPHNPYIFASDGTFMPRQEQNMEAYINQPTYVNHRMISIVTEILENSAVPPIIIIQGDHGSTEVEFTPLRVMILNAYYLPNDGEKMLYSTITPVNSFRLILDYYFGSDYGFLEDISYNSKSKEDTLDFEVIPNLCDQ